MKPLREMRDLRRGLLLAKWSRVEDSSIDTIEEVLEDSCLCRGRIGCKGVKNQGRKWEKVSFFI